MSIDLENISDLSRWEVIEIPLPSGTRSSKGLWTRGEDIFIEATGKRGVRALIHEWKINGEKPEKISFGKAASYAVYGLNKNGFCGQTFRGESSTPVIWDGKSLEPTSLNTEGCTEGFSVWGSGGQIVGVLEVPDEEDDWDTEQRAVLWNDKGKATWLGPEGLPSYAGHTDGLVQAGHVCWDGGDRRFACMWRGDEQSLVKLHPDHCLVSEVNGVDGDLQFGYIGIAKGKNSLDTYHPAIWYGSAESVVDLIPSEDYKGGDVFHSCKNIQAGSVWKDVNRNDSPTDEKACIWQESAKSFVLLHELLEPKFIRSQANNISVLEDEIIIVGSAWIGSADSRAVVWRYS